jgi:hypothetical protein
MMVEQSLIVIFGDAQKSSGFGHFWAARLLVRAGAGFSGLSANLIG